MPEPLEPRYMLAANLTGQELAPALADLFAAEAGILNAPLTSDSGVQQMPSVAVNPLDADHVVVAYMDYSLLDTGYGGLGVAVSRDGGESWQNSTIPLPAGFDQGASDPVVLFDGEGRLFVSFVAVTFLAGKAPLVNPSAGNPRVLGMQANNGIFVARSDDGGLSWDAVDAVVSHLFDGTTQVPYETVPDLAIDTVAVLPGGHPNPAYCNLYVTWTRFYPAGQFPGQPDAMGGSDVMISVSEDQGQTWQLRTRPQPGTGVDETVLQGPSNNGRDAPPGRGYMVWPQAAVGAGGDIYVADFFASWFAVSHSSDAAKSFFVPTRQDRLGLPFGPSSKILTAGLTNNVFRTLPVRAIAADPVRPGHVYVAEPLPVLDAEGNPLDAADIFFSRSTDFGQTWERTILRGGNRADLINDDNGGRKATGADDEVAADQFMVELQVNAQGDVGLVWYDTRRDPANHALDVFGAISTDGGRTFSSNFRVTDQSFDADIGRFTDATGAENTFIGDAIGLAMGQDVAYIAWTDTRAGNQDISFRRVTLAPPPAPLNDQFEPNETAEAATVIGEIVAPRHLARLGLPEGDEDWFQLESPASGTLTVTASGSEGIGALILEIRDAAGEQVLAQSTAVRDALGNVVGQQAEFASVSGQSYQVRVVAASAVVQYSLRLQSLTADLGPIVHRLVDGTLQADDQAYYLLQSVATGAISAKLMARDGAAGQAVLELLDGEHHSVVLASTSGEAPETSVAVTKGQKLLVRVSGADATAFQGAFRLELSNLDQFTAPGRNVLHFAAGAGPSQEVSADFNRDGRPDIAIANAAANVVSISLGNGDGTFTAPRQFAVGAFRTPNPVGDDAHLNMYRRDILAADFNKDGLVDLAVTNYDSSDVSILLGQGDGTFQSQRRFEAASFPFGLASGDVNNDGHLDLVVIDTPEINVPNQLAVLLGRGDGTFAPQILQVLPEQKILFLAVAALGDLDNDGNLDLIVGGGINEGIDVFPGRGDGTFDFPGQRYSGSRQATDLIVSDFTGDSNLDVLATSLSDDNGVVLLQGDGEGGLGEAEVFFAGQGPLAVKAVDWGSPIKGANSSQSIGPPDGKVDLIVANSGVIPGPVTPVGAPGVVVLLGLEDENGDFDGFSDPLDLAPAEQPLDVEIRDYNGDGNVDVAVVNRGEFFVIFGSTPTIPDNGTRADARELGKVVHVVQPTLTITPEHNDAWYRLTVPTEVVPGAGDQILDVSGGFNHAEGLGLRMEVSDTAGNILGSGERLRVVAGQGETLLVHVFGVADSAGNPGSGAYTLVIDVLPQVVAVESQSLLPGLGRRPGGPTTSIVITLQGDRLDPATAENPANYRVTWLGRDRTFGTRDDRLIPVGSGLPASQQFAVYDASSNIDVASGLIVPTAIRQTVTLLFGEPLPAGSYRIEALPGVQSAPFNLEELDLLSARNGFTGHPVASVVAAGVVEGRRFRAGGLVQRSTLLGDLSQFNAGTPYLSQLIGDLGAMLDAQLTELGDDKDITAQILDQIVAQLGPALGLVGQPIVPLVVYFFDPPNIGMEVLGRSLLSHDQSSNSLVNKLLNTYAGVDGNVALIVMANPIGTHNIKVAHVGPLVRGGAVYINGGPPRITLLTQDMRGGQQNFTFEYSSPSPIPPPVPIVPGPAKLAANTAAPGAQAFIGSNSASQTAKQTVATSATTPAAATPPVGSSGGEAAARPPLQVAVWEWLTDGIRTLWGEIRRRLRFALPFRIMLPGGMLTSAAVAQLTPREQTMPDQRPDGAATAPARAEPPAPARKNSAEPSVQADRDAVQAPAATAKSPQPQAADPSGQGKPEDVQPARERIPHANRP